MGRPVLFRIAAFGFSVGCTGNPGPDAVAQTSGVATYEVGARPRSLAVAELNGDQHLDVVVANSGDDTLTLLLGTPEGRLRTTATLPAGSEPSDVDGADLDLDGDLDLVVANHETSRITVLINDGRAGFSSAPDSPFDTGALPHSHGLATGDFDGDGRIDVAVEGSDSRDVRILPGREEGFGPVVTVPIGTMPYFRLGVGDVTGDGLADILVPGHGDDTLRAAHYRNGAFARADWRIELSAQPWMVVADDFDGDDRTDVAAVITDGVEVWLHRPDGFVPAPGSPFPVRTATEVATGDLDGDGVAEIVVGPWDGQEVTILEGGTFAIRTIHACTRPVGLALADLNGDGRAEILATCSTENRLVVLPSPFGP